MQRACGAMRNEGLHAPCALYHMHHVGLHFPIAETLPLPNKFEQLCLPGNVDNDILGEVCLGNTVWYRNTVCPSRCVFCRDEELNRACCTVYLLYM